MENPPKDIKLIAIDIDGTLLTPDGQITPRTRLAIQFAQQAGIIVTLATSRRYRGVKAIAEALGLELPLIVYDGALIVHHPSQVILHSQPLPISVAAQAVEVFQKHRVQPIIQPSEPTRCVHEEVWSGPTVYDQPELAAYLSIASERLRRMPYAQICQPGHEPLRVVAFASAAAIQQLLPEISRLACSWHTIAQGSYNCPELSIMHPASSKASAVATLAAHFQVELEEVMALGDNNNDCEMLRTVGWGVAMGQASESVQATARAVTATNSEEGVALAIERYALSQHPEHVPALSGEALAKLPALPSFNLQPIAQDQTSRAK